MSKQKQIERAMELRDELFDIADRLDLLDPDT